MSNATIQIITASILLIHVAAFAWAVLRRTTRPLAWLNVLGAAFLWLVSAPRLGRVIASGDVQSMMFFGGALVSAALSLAWLAGRRIPSPVIWAFFVAQTIACAMVTVFAFTFKIGRLF